MQMGLNLDNFVDIPNYEGLYKINKNGIIYGVKRNNILKYDIRGNATKYKSVLLYKNGKGKHYTVHYLVALTFIPNPYDYETVDHIDRNSFNNNVENLRWATMKMQCKNRDYTNIGGKKEIEMRDKDNHFVLIKSFKSATEASRFIKKSESHISQCANGLRKSAYGYWWCYKGDYNESN